MKKSPKIIIVGILVIIIIFIGLFILKYSSNEKIIEDKDGLYVKVERYLISLEKPQYFLETKDSIPNYNIEDFKVFTDIAKLGIRQKGTETDVYIWALIEDYYVQDGKLIQSSGSSMPYKFIIKNNEIVSYKVPEDGDRYAESLKKIFPNDIRLKLANSLVDNDKIDKQVKEYYSYLSNN